MSAHRALRAIRRAFLVGLADALDVRLVDWWVMFGTKAFSAAGSAPTPAAW
jgi:hypothetical protein